jgi:hypothetical protein
MSGCRILRESAPFGDDRRTCGTRAREGEGGCATVYIGGKHRIHVEFAETHLSSPMLLRGRPAPSAILWLKSVALIDALFGLL